MNIGDLATPALVLDKARVRHNIARMHARARALGVAFRPHFKTCKSIDVMRLMLGDVGIGGTVSTLREAECLLDAGIRDITYAVGIAPAKLVRVADLMRRGASLRILLDDGPTAREVAAAGAALGVVFNVLVEIDSDGHRAGVAPGDPRLLEIAALLTASPGATFDGVLTHAGSSYGCRSREAIAATAEQERLAAVTAAASLRAAGLPCPVVSVGSTPTATFARSLEGVTELRAGVFVFNDLSQVQLGVCALDDIATTVLATVIGHQRRDRRGLIVDAGALALSKDRSTASMQRDLGYGLAVPEGTARNASDLVVTQAFQEHGVITSAAGNLDPDRYPIGSRVTILPNHACITAAAHDFYEVVDGDGVIVDRWARANGW